MLNLLGQALGLVGNVAGNYLERKAEEQKAKTEIAKKVAQSEVDWENQWARNADNGWLDEFYGVLLAIPIVLVFFGDEYAERVKAGFNALNESVPEWYIAAWLAAVGAAFGLRSISKWKR